MRAGEASIRLGVTMDNVGIARRFVARKFERSVPREVVDDLVLATSELVTNALEHARSATVVVTARSDLREASVSVRSTGEHDLHPDVSAWRATEPDRVSGRGLGIVHAIVDDIDVQRSGDSLEITVRRRFGADPER